VGDAGVLVQPAAAPRRFRRREPGKGDLNPAWLTESFGRPAHVYRIADSTVLTWHKNLLTEVGGNTPFTPDGTQD